MVEGISYAEIRVLVCREMHWDFWVFQRQPARFVADILNTMIAEAKVREESSRGTHVDTDGYEEVPLP